jgi:carbon monoxide dehydrogenase subunit G
MEVKLDKRYPIPASPAQAWAVLSDVRATAACMPGAQITEQVDVTHFKGSVKSKVGPAVMQFAGDIEVLALDAATRTLKMLGKGADKAGSSAQMTLEATVEDSESGAQSVLVGQATIVVSGKLAQFGSRLLVPVSDALLAQFAENFRSAAQAVPFAGGADGGDSAEDSMLDTTKLMVQHGGLPGGHAAPPQPPARPVKELNALALMWQVFTGWLAGLFGRKKA